MQIDRTINVGQILTMVVIVTSVIAAYYSIHYDIKLLRTLHDDRIARLEAATVTQRESNKQMIDALSSIRTDIAIMRIQMSKDYETSGGPRRPGLQPMP